MQRVIANFTHGLGDCVQFTIVLKHLKKYRPDWAIDVAASDGRTSCFHGLCNNAYLLSEARRPYDLKYDVSWMEPSHFTSYTDLPRTKVTRSLIEEFKLDPDVSLYKYHIQPSSHDRTIAKQYISTLPKSEGVVGIHYKGTTSGHTKNIEDDVIKKLCNHLYHSGYTPVILDWNNSCSFVNNTTVYCPNRDHFLWKGTRLGEASTIAALIEKMKLFIGIDSGPLHVAGATETPSLGVWTRHHPINFFDLCSNVRHLLPKDSRRFMRGKDRQGAEHYFQEHYAHSYYSDLQKSLFNEVSNMLGRAISENTEREQIVGPQKWWVIEPCSTL
mgnify:CR=1 FL=1